MYLKIAFLAIARLLLHIRRRYPPPTRSQQHAQPTLKIFYFFIFSAKVLTWCFRYCCAYFVFVLVGGGAADGLTEIIKHGVWQFRVIRSLLCVMSLFLCYKRKFIVSFWLRIKSLCIPPQQLRVHWCISVATRKTTELREKKKEKRKQQLISTHGNYKIFLTLYNFCAS